MGVTKDRLKELRVEFPEIKKFRRNKNGTVDEAYVDQLRKEVQVLRGPLTPDEVDVLRYFRPGQGTRPHDGFSTRILVRRKILHQVSNDGRCILTSFGEEVCRSPQFRAAVAQLTRRRDQKTAEPEQGA